MGRSGKGRRESSLQTFPSAARQRPDLPPSAQASDQHHSEFDVEPSAEMHVAFATSTAYPVLTPDDRLAASACADRGMRVSPAVWSDPDVAWSSHDAVVIRSTWDYHRRATEFDHWLTRLAGSGTAVWNPIPLVRWNANKRYLADLASRGVATVPTAWLTDDAGASLGDVMDRHGWTDVVVKPTV